MQLPSSTSERYAKVATSAPVTRVTAIGSDPAEALGFGIASLAGSSSPIRLDETDKNGDSVEKTLLALAETRNTYFEGTHARAQCVDAILTISSKRTHAQQGLPVLDTST